MTKSLLDVLNATAGLLNTIDPGIPVGSNVITVGFGKMFSTIGAAVASARDGQIILVSAGTYTNDFVHVTSKLTIIGVGGMVNLVATIPCPDHKAIMTVGADLTLKNFTFAGATVSAADGGNGAGIRYEGGKLVLYNDAFYNNQNGLMGGGGADGTTHEIDIDHCLFSGNGSGSGNTHNIYVGTVDVLNVTNSIFEKANVGHELKSRAYANNIANNIFRDTSTGTASYDIDLPNGGVDVVTNNVIEKGPLAQNNSMVHFGGEGLPYAASSLVLQGNMFINDKNSSVSGVLNQSGIPVSILNNTFVNVAAANISLGPATITGNVNGNGAAIANSTTTDPVPGSTVSFTDAAAHAVTLGLSPLAVRGGAGHLTVFAQGGHVFAIGGSGGMDFTEAVGSGANQITTAAGSTNKLTLTGGDTVSSAGADTIVTDQLNSTGSISGTARVDTSGSDIWTIKGTATVNGRAAASPFLTLNAGATLNLTGQFQGVHLTNIGGTATVDTYGAAADGTKQGHISWSVAGGSNSSYIWQGVTHIQTSAGPTGSTVRLGDGAAEVLSFAKDSIWAGAGTANIVLGGGGTDLHAGTGNLTIYGRSLQRGNEAKVYGNGGSYTFGGDTGNIIYYGGNTASTVTLNLSFMTLIGGAGKLTVVGGSAEQIVGGSGGIDYTAGALGNASITTSAGSTNVLRLDSGGGVSSWGNDTIIGGKTNDTITVHGNATVTGGTGLRTITLMGTDTFTHAGSASVTVTAGADATISIAGAGNINETSATARVSVAGTNASSAVVQGGQATIGTGLGGINITTTAKNSTNITLAGPANVAVLGADTVHAGAGLSTILIGATAATIYAGSGSMTLRDGAGGLKFIGAAGDSTLTIYGGGNDVVFGAGHTTVAEWASGAADTYEFIAGKGGGTDVISGFRIGVDHLSLQGVIVTSQSVAGGSANLVLSDNTHLQLVGVSNPAKVFS